MSFKDRTKKSIRRKQPKFSGDRILVVCEDSKSSPNYFEELKTFWKIHPAQIKIAGKECRSDRIKIVEYAIKQAELENEIAFDQVWCVFDHEAKNRPENLEDAIQLAKQHKIKIALSCPCFEFWYLLHFIQTTSPFQNQSELLKQLKKTFTQIQKRRNVFPRINSKN